MQMKNHAARILLFPKGGRDADYMADWARLELKPEGTATRFGCEIRTTTNATLGLGQSLSVTIFFFNELDPAQSILAGKTFSLFEGARHVGDGIWT
jgi:hypothetical protein